MRQLLLTEHEWTTLSTVMYQLHPLSSDEERIASKIAATEPFDPDLRKPVAIVSKNVKLVSGHIVAYILYSVDGTLILDRPMARLAGDDYIICPWLHIVSRDELPDIATSFNVDLRRIEGYFHD
jgi:hypothetical protein